MHHVGSVEPIQPRGEAGAHKPLGFWVSDDNDFGWADWCKAEDFGSYCYRYEVRLCAPERILWLCTEAEVREFADKYCKPPTWADNVRPSSFRRDPHFYYREPLWGRVATEFAGVIITPYQWPLRLKAGFSWYYGWDCASGVIWDGSVVADLIPTQMLEPWTERALPAGDSSDE